MILNLKLCSPDNVDSIMNLQDMVFATIGEDSPILRRNTREMFVSCCREPNVSIGLFDGDTMIGIGIAVDVAGTAEDLTLHLKQHDASGLRPCNLKLVMIDEHYYGMGFQNAIMWLLERIMFDRGYECICSTVSPDNVYSNNNCVIRGYEYDHEEVKYGGLVRSVYFKIIDNSPIGEKTVGLIKAIMQNENVQYDELLKIKSDEGK